MHTLLRDFEGRYMYIFVLFIVFIKLLTDWHFANTQNIYRIRWFSCVSFFKGVVRLFSVKKLTKIDVADTCICISNGAT